MNVAIGCDHGGVDLKNALIDALGDVYTITDYGTYSHERVDYPDFAEAVARDVAAAKFDFGILICTTGMGISIAANKIPGVRAAVVYNEDGAEFSRRHNNANVICFGQKYQTAYEAAKYARIFLQTPFEGGRHADRVGKIHLLESGA